MAKGVELPPTVELMLSEVPTFESPFELLDHLLKRGLVRELVAQAEYTRNKWQFEHQPRNQRGMLRLCPAGGLNPFDKWGKCMDVACTTATAERFARTVGLYSDDVVVMDTITSLILRFRPDAYGDRMLLNSNVAALRALEPLLRAGIVRFGMDPPVCVQCDKALDSFVASNVPETVTHLKEGLRYDLQEREGEFFLGLYFSGDPFAWGQPIPPEIAARFRRTEVPLTPTRYEGVVLLRFLRTIAESLERTILRGATTSVRSKGIFAAADPIIGRVWESAQGAQVEARLDLQQMQSVDLPFIGELTPAETIILREEASRALPAFRARIEASVQGAQDRGAAARAVSELRAQALEVRAELGAVRAGQSWRTGLVTGSVGLAVGILAASPPAPVAVAALASALAAVSLMHPHTANAKKETAKLEALPGYVFVAAEDVLRHADGKN